MSEGSQLIQVSTEHMVLSSYCIIYCICNWVCAALLVLCFEMIPLVLVSAFFSILCRRELLSGRSISFKKVFSLMAKVCTVCWRTFLFYFESVYLRVRVRTGVYVGRDSVMIERQKDYVIV